VENENNLNLDAVIQKAHPKQVGFDSGSIYVNIPGETVSFAELEAGTGGSPPSIPTFFYVYINRKHESRMMEIRNYLIKNH
jgi:hypothetical protein